MKTFSSTDALFFVLFYLLAGFLAGAFFITYLTEPDPFLEHGPVEVAK